jgi:hypothetical protein
MDCADLSVQPLFFLNKGYYNKVASKFRLASFYW